MVVNIKSTNETTMNANEMRALGDLSQALGEGIMTPVGDIPPEFRARYEAQRDHALKQLSTRPMALLCEGVCDFTIMHNLINGFWQCEICGYRIPNQME